MNCEDIDRLLSLLDPDARGDRGQMRPHFRSCSRCGERYPEIPALYRELSELPDRMLAALPGRRRTVSFAAAAAALLLIAVTGFLSTVDQKTDAPASAGTVRPLLQTVSLVQHRTIRFEPNQVVFYRTTRGTFRPGPERPVR
ncbi:MAG: hypothetical protein V2A76_17475 [Planctomycetota bacterium]